ncbi:hypothetical protein BDR22DRAFT_684511 [Usnea florida]
MIVSSLFPPERLRCRSGCSKRSKTLLPHFPTGLYPIENQERSRSSFKSFDLQIAVTGSKMSITLELSGIRIEHVFEFPAMDLSSLSAISSKDIQRLKVLMSTEYVCRGTILSAALLAVIASFVGSVPQISRASCLYTEQDSVLVS